MLDHVGSDQHRKALCLSLSAQAKASNEPIISCTSIAHSLLMLDEVERERMRRKFDLCYLISKEGIAFETSLALYELEARQGV